MEEEVLLGAEKTIMKFKPIIVFEAFEETRKKVFEVLYKFSYKIKCPINNPVDFTAFSE